MKKYKIIVTETIIAHIYLEAESGKDAWELGGQRIWDDYITNQEGSGVRVQDCETEILDVIEL